MTNWKHELFPDLAYPAYLNHAAISPLNRRVRQAMHRLMDEYGQRGVKAWTVGNDCRDRLRESLATMIGCGALDIGLVSNTSHGLLTVAYEYPWQAGDRLVLFRGEFPGNVVPWLSAAEHYQLEVIWLNHDDLLEQSPQFQEAMKKRPVMMAVSWVQFQTGRVQPMRVLSEIRERFGVHVCVDAIQGLGPLTLDLRDTPVDFLVCGGHKWLLGPEGVGFMYVHPHRTVEMRPLLVGWLSQEDPVSFLFKGSGWIDYGKPYRQEPGRVEMATMNSVGFAGLEASIGLYLEIGPETVHGRVQRLAHRCREGLRTIGLEPVCGEDHAGNISVALADDQLKHYALRLDELGIIVSAPDGHLRISPHFYNEPADIDLCLEHFDQIHREWLHHGSGGEVAQ